MAMQGFDREAFSAPMAEINTTPLVDVMLVLVVIFLVTAPMLTQAVKLELPSEIATEVEDENPITLSVMADGSYHWGEESITEEQLDSRLKSAAMADKAQPIHLRADVKAAYGNVSLVLTTAQKHGLNNIGFITEPK